MKAKKYTKETIQSVGMYDRSFPAFSVGDTIAVSQRVTEGGKKRIQIFEGNVILLHRNGASTTFTVRKIGANAIAVERIFPYYSPHIEAIRVVSRGAVRRANLRYLRRSKGKKSIIREKVLTKKQREQKKEARAAEKQTNNDQ